MARRQNATSYCDLSVLESVAPMGTWCWDPGDDIVAWSDGLRRLWGLAAAPDATLATLLSACHPLDRSSLEEACREARDKGSSFTLRHRVIIDCRGERLMVTYGRAEDGAIQGLSQDVTDAVRTEVQLREAIAVTEAIVRHAGIGMLTVDLDSRLILAANPAMCRMLGYSEEETIGMAIADLTYHDDPDAKTDLANNITRTNAGPYTREKRYRRKDGSVMWGRITATRADGVDDTPLAGVGLIENIDEERRRLNQLQAQEAEMRAVFEGAYSAILLINADGTLRSTNPKGERMFGLPPDAMVGQPITMLFPVAYSELVMQQLDRERATIEAEALGADGSTVPVIFSAVAVDHGEDEYYVAFVRDISDLKARETTLMAERDRIETQAIELAALTEQSHANAAKLELANQELTRLATTDTLTGILNRRMVMDRGAAEFQRQQRYGNHVGVIALDIDHFKKVNDTYGHGGGDAALRAVADACHSCLREVDAFGRIGGEEFLVVLPETDQSGAEVVAEKIRATVDALRIKHGDDTIELTISAGATVMTDSGLEAAIDLADQALYAAKNGGRNKVVFGAPETTVATRLKQA